MRLSRPISQVGPAARRNARIRLQNRQQVQRRARGRCEGCGAADRPMECAHLYGKGGTGAGLDEGWSSQPEMCAALCCWAPNGMPGCHQRIDRGLDPDLRDQLRWQALARLTERFPLADFWPCNVSFGPVAMAREAVRRLEAEGWYWDEALGEIVKDGIA